jgi:hypothetical protein
MRAPIGLREIEDLQAEVMMHASHKPRIVAIDPTDQSERAKITQKPAPSPEAEKK